MTDVGKQQSRQGRLLPRPSRLRRGTAHVRNPPMQRLMTCPFGCPDRPLIPEVRLRRVGHGEEGGPHPDRVHLRLVHWSLPGEHTPEGPPAGYTEGALAVYGITAPDPRAIGRDSPRRRMRGGAVYSGAESAKDRRAPDPYPVRPVGRIPRSRRHPDRPDRGARQGTGPPTHGRCGARH
jgi:hypothetical protein